MNVMSPRYWVDVSGSPTHQAQLERIPPASKVLEIGAAGGYMTRALVERGCRVWAIEAENSLASAVPEAGSRVFVGDIECMDFGDAPGGERFDGPATLAANAVTLLGGGGPITHSWRLTSPLGC